MLRRTAGAATAALIMVMTAAGAPAVAKKPTPPAPVAAGCADAAVIPADVGTRSAAGAALLCLVNAERAQHALGALGRSAPLSRAATLHSGDMVRRKYFSHVSPDGKNLHRRVAKTGYVRQGRNAVLGETIAWGSSALATPTELVKSLMGSPAHRTIILSSRFRDIGVGLSLGAPLEGFGSSGATLALTSGRR